MGLWYGSDGEDPDWGSDGPLPPMTDKQKEDYRIKRAEMDARREVLMPVLEALSRIGVIPENFREEHWFKHYSFDKVDPWYKEVPGVSRDGKLPGMVAGITIREFWKMRGKESLTRLIFVWATSTEFKVVLLVEVKNRRRDLYYEGKEELSFPRKK